MTAYILLFVLPCAVMAPFSIRAARILLAVRALTPSSAATSAELASLRSRMAAQAPFSLGLKDAARSMELRPTSANFGHFSDDERVFPVEDDSCAARHLQVLDLDALGVSEAFDSGHPGSVRLDVLGFEETGGDELIPALGALVLSRKVRFGSLAAEEPTCVVDLASL